MNKKIELQLKITEAHLQFHKNEEMFLELVKKLIDQQTQLIGKNITEKNLNQILNNFNNTMGLLERNQVMYNKSHDRFLKMNLENDENNDEYYPQKLLSEAKDSNSKKIEENNKELKNNEEPKTSEELKTNKFNGTENNRHKELKNISKENELINVKEKYYKNPITNLNNENKEYKIDVEKKMRDRLQKKIDEIKNETIDIEKQNSDEVRINFKIEDNDIDENEKTGYEYQIKEFEFEDSGENIEHDKEDLIGIIISTVVEMTGYPESIISEEMDLKSDLGFDSIKINELINFLENKSIVINQKEIALLGINIKTITDLAEAVISVSKKKLNM